MGRMLINAEAFQCAVHFLTKSINRHMKHFTVTTHPLFNKGIDTGMDRNNPVRSGLCLYRLQSIDPAKADMTIFDSSGIEAFVTENNPKYANRIIRQLKAYAKANNFDKNYDPYKAAYGSMPIHASANPEIKQLYINGLCYVYKFGIVTNGLGIIRHTSFYNKDFMTSHPEIVVEKNLILLMKISVFMMLNYLFLY